MNKRKMKKELIPANDDRFSALWEGSEKCCFEPVSKQIIEWRTSKTSLDIIVAKMGPTKTVIITLPCDRFWLTKLKGYHNPSSWQNFADQNEGWS